MMTQTWALLVDAYRELNSKKLFWITMALSGVVVLICAMIGIDEEGMSFFVWRLDFVRFPNGTPITSAVLPPEVLYKQIFMEAGLGIWLTWIAAVLALISTAGIIPEMVTGGTIETLLARPISRLRLLLTKYVCGLLFVALQVSVFTVASMVVIGIRGRSWEPAMLLAIPLVVCFFSYLFSICAFIGMATRSTIAALLLTLLAWFLIFVVNAADTVIVATRAELEAARENYGVRVERAEENTRKKIVDKMREDGVAVEPGYEPADSELLRASPYLSSLRDKRDDAAEDLKKSEFWADLAVTVKTFLPKTQETVSLLERSLVSLTDMRRLAEAASEGEQPPTIDESNMNPDTSGADLKMAEVLRSRSAGWVLGTSLGFEVVMLGLTALVFARRDF